MRHWLSIYWFIWHSTAELPIQMSHYLFVTDSLLIQSWMVMAFTAAPPSVGMLNYWPLHKRQVLGQHWWKLHCSRANDEALIVYLLIRLTFDSWSTDSGFCHFQCKRPSQDVFFSNIRHWNMAPPTVGKYRDPHDYTLDALDCRQCECGSSMWPPETTIFHLEGIRHCGAPFRWNWKLMVRPDILCQLLHW